MASSVIQGLTKEDLESMSRIIDMYVTIKASHKMIPKGVVDLLGFLNSDNSLKFNLGKAFLEELINARYFDRVLYLPQRDGRPKYILADGYSFTPEEESYIRNLPYEHWENSAGKIIKYKPGKMKMPNLGGALMFSDDADKFISGEERRSWYSYTNLDTKDYEFKFCEDNIKYCILSDDFSYFRENDGNKSWSSGDEETSYLVKAILAIALILGKEPLSFKSNNHTKMVELLRYLWNSGMLKNPGQWVFDK